MAQSMTGFGRCEAQSDGRVITIELKSVNHRFLDISMRFSRSLGFLEDTVRGVLGGRLLRGHVDVFVTYENHRNDAKQVELNADLLMAFVEKAKSVEGMIKNDLCISDFLKMPEVFSLVEQEDDREQLQALCATALRGACDELVMMRKREGECLCADLKARAMGIIKMLAAVNERAPMVVIDYKQRLENRLAELLGQNTPIDPARLASEVAIFADKASITEEVVRLDAHLKSFTNLLEAKDAVGRKLDFLVQEMNREINTVGSKVSDLAVTALVIDIKSELEKIREQVQNIQ